MRELRGCLRDGELLALRLTLGALALHLRRRLDRLVHPAHDLVEQRDAVRPITQPLDQLGVGLGAVGEAAVHRRHRVVFEPTEHAGLVDGLDGARHRHHQLGLGLHLADQMRAVAIGVAKHRGFGEAGHLDAPALDLLLRRPERGQQHVLDGAGWRAEAEGQGVADGELHQ